MTTVIETGVVEKERVGCFGLFIYKINDEAFGTLNNPQDSPCGQERKEQASVQGDGRYWVAKQGKGVAHFMALSLVSLPEESPNTG